MPKLSSPGAQPALMSKTNRAWAPNCGWTHTITLDPSSSQPGAWHIYKSPRCLPDPERSSHPSETPVPGATTVALGPSGSAAAALQRQPWNFSQALGCPQKCRFLQECTKTGGLRRPGPPLSPSCCPSPAQGPPLPRLSPSLPAAPMLPISCPEAPVPPAGFSHGSRRTRQLPVAD